MTHGPNERQIEVRDTASLVALVGELVADLKTLAFLHDRELDQKTLEKLRNTRVLDWFGLGLDGAEAQDVIALLDEALAKLPDPIDEPFLEALAVDYANIYLTYGYRASPTESVWFDDDGLDRQGPMFAVRRWYTDYGVEAADWRRRPDDHLVLELLFIAHLFETMPPAEACALAARFLDDHLLRWIGSFAHRVAARCETHLYGALTLFTAVYLDELRNALAVLTGKKRPAEQSQPDSAPCPAMDAENSYAPGAGPSW